MASDSSSGFFSSPTRGITHFFMDTQNTTERMEEKNKRTNTDLGQLQLQEGGSLRDTFVQLSEHLQAIAGEYLRKTSTEPLGMLTHLLTVLSALLLSFHCLLLLTVSFSGQLSQANCSLLLSFINWLCLLWDFPSLPDFQSHAVWVSRQNRQRDPLSGAKTNRNECYPLCHICVM